MQRQLAWNSRRIFIVQKNTLHRKPCVLPQQHRLALIRPIWVTNSTSNDASDYSNIDQSRRDASRPKASDENMSLASIDNGNLSSADDAGGAEQKPNLLQRLALSVRFALGSFFAMFGFLSPSRLLAKTQGFTRLLGLYFKSAHGRVSIILLFLGSLMFAANAAGRRSGAVVSAPQEVIYSEFLNLVNSGNVRAARFEDGTGRILFDLKLHSSQLATQAAGSQGLVPASTSTSTASISSAGAAGSLTAKTPVNPRVVAMLTKAGVDFSNSDNPSTSAATATAAETTSRRSRYRVPRQFYTRHIADPQLIAALTAAGVEFGSIKPSAMAALTRMLITILMLWVPLIPLFIIMKRTLDGRNGASKKPKSKRNAQERITFAQVAGVDSAVLELQEVVACLRDSQRFAKLGAKMPSGVLLCGPPGTGKTLLAKAVAGEAGVPFLSASASEFVEMFVGRGAARVRELFAEARKQSPCVVFIDELDAVGGKRGIGLNEERDQTLNQLLTELDGFEGRPGVLLLAATNRPQVLDDALLRPGRLSRKVNVPLPDEEGRARILLVHMSKVPIEAASNDDVVQQALTIARVTPGFSGAELANVVNESAFLAARRQADSISLEDLVESVSRTKYGVNGKTGGASGGFMKRMQNLLVDLASSKNGVRTQPLGS